MEIRNILLYNTFDTRYKIITVFCCKMAHEPLIETLLKVGGGHSCEILKWLAKICEICPDMGVGHYAAVGHFAVEYGICHGNYSASRSSLVDILLLRQYFNI